MMSKFMTSSVSEGNEKSYQLLRDSLDLYLTINPDNVQYLLLQARLYFHLGIWPEKVRKAGVVFKRIPLFTCNCSEVVTDVNTSSTDSSLFPGARHPAAHSGVGPLAARGGGLPGAAHARAHPAQEAPCNTRSEEAQRSRAPGSPVFSRPYYETQEVGLSVMCCSRARTTKD